MIHTKKIIEVTKTTTNHVPSDHKSEPEFSFVIYRYQQSAVRWLGTVTTCALRFVSQCWKWLQLSAGQARRFLKICTPGSGAWRAFTNLPEPDTKLLTMKHIRPIVNAPLAPDQSADMDSSTTPAVILQGLISAFTEPDAPPAIREAALALDWLLMLDPSAEDDLLDAIGCHSLNVTNAAGFDAMLAKLKAIGAADQWYAPGQTEVMRLKFDARPLIRILKSMPHRDPDFGLSHNLITNCTQQSK